MVALIEWLTSTFMRIITAILTLLLGLLIGKVLGRLVKRILKEAEVNRMLHKAGLHIAFDYLASRLIEYAIYAVTVLIVLRQLGLTRIFLGAIIVIVSVAVILPLVLWLKDFLPNAISWLLLRKQLKRSLKKHVRIGSVSGKLVQFGILKSKIKTPKGDEIHIPHAYTIFKRIKQLRAS